MQVEHLISYTINQRYCETLCII